MLPKLSSCFKSIKPFFDNSKEATKLDEMMAVSYTHLRAHET